MISFWNVTSVLILDSKLKSHFGSYWSHQYQNDVDTLIENVLRQKIISEVKSANYCTILVDKTQDVSRKQN